MKSSRSNTSHSSEATVMTLGEKLSHARTLRGLPIEDVARQMNLSVSTIRALESDNHRGLPGRTFVRGYLRNYARIISVPVDELVAAYDAQFSEEEEPVAFLAPRRSAALRWLGPVIILVGLLLVGGLIAGIVALVGKHWFVVAETAQSLAQPVISTVTDAVPASHEPPPPPAPEQLPSPVKQELGGSADVAAPSSAPEPQAGSVITPLAAPVVSAAPAEPDTAGKPRAADAPASAANADKGRVVLTFSADCWLSATDAKGRALFIGTRRAGDVLALDGIPPIKLVLGNGRAVRVKYNDEAVAVDDSEPTHVVTLSLGRR